MEKIIKFAGKNIPILITIFSATTSLLFKSKRTTYILASLSIFPLIYSLFSRLSSRPGDDDGETPLSENIKSTEVDGITMKWEEHGAADNVPVVFIHGIPTGPRLWRYVIPRLALQGVRCYAWNMVGYANSWRESFEHDISVQKQTEYLHQWLRNQNINKAIFIGHDLGGGVVQRFAVLHPGYCLGIVLTDCVAYDNWPIPMMKYLQKNTGIIRVLPHWLLKPFLISSLLKIGHNNRQRGLKSLNLHWLTYKHARGTKAFAQQINSLNNNDTISISGKLSSLDISTRIVWGEQDRLSLESAQRLAQDLKAELIVIPGARHFTPEEHPNILAASINHVLVEISQKVPMT